TFRVVLFNIHSDEWKSFQIQHQTALRISRWHFNLTPAESKFKTPMLDHQDKYMMKAQVHVSKSFAISDIQPLPRRKHYCQIYQVVKHMLRGRLLASFQDREHEGGDTRSQGGIKENDIKIKIQDHNMQMISQMNSQEQGSKIQERSHEDFQPLPRIFTKAIFTHEEPRALYRHYQLKANQTPIKWINLMHGEHSPKTLKFQQQKKQSKPCEVYRQSYNVRPKSTLENLLNTTTGLTKEKTSEFKTNKPEESSLNWKPLHNDWAAATSKPTKVQANKPKNNKCRYNKKGFLEDDEGSDDLIFIVDPGWDDYRLQELKLNNPVPCCPDARRTRM
nr:heme peroxidase [Tanacetum cinerariifolium]